MILFFGSRAPGGKKGRQETTARKDATEATLRKNETEATPRKDETEGGKEGGQEGRKRPHVCSQLRRKLWQERCFC